MILRSVIFSANKKEHSKNDNRPDIDLCVPLAGVPCVGYTHSNKDYTYNKYTPWHDPAFFFCRRHGCARCQTVSPIICGANAARSVEKESGRGREINDDIELTVLPVLCNLERESARGWEGEREREREREKHRLREREIEREREESERD